MNEPKVVFTFNAGAYAIDEDGDFFEDISGKWRRNSIRPDRMIGRELARLAARVEELEFGAHGVTADELRAEIKRLREALEEIAAWEGCDGDSGVCGNIAARALEASDESESTG